MNWKKLTYSQRMTMMRISKTMMIPDAVPATEI